MARVTARQAFTRSRTKKFQERDQKAKELKLAKQKFIQQILGVVNARNNRQPSERKPVSQTSTSSSSTSSNNKHQVLNHKITDYYSVKAKGRENVPQTPPRLGRNLKQQQRKKDSNSFHDSSIDSEPLIITIGDTDDEEEEEDLKTDNEAENNVQDRLSQDYKTSEDSSYDERDENGSTSGSQLESPFVDPNFSIKVEEDLEIVGMLPPIALRDHPVIDLDEED